MQDHQRHDPSNETEEERQERLQGFLKECQEARAAAKDATVDAQSGSGDAHGGTPSDVPDGPLERIQMDMRDPWIEPKLERIKGTLVIDIHDIETEAEVMQPRPDAGQILETQEVVSEIKQAIRNAGVMSLDPLAIWWTGRRWLVCDGHHRFKAILEHNADALLKPIGDVGVVQIVPVRIVRGDLTDALRAATSTNGKATIQLRKKDRAEFAWTRIVMHLSGKLETDRKFVAAQEARYLHLSERSLRTMVKAFWKISGWLAEEGISPEGIFEKLEQLSWAKARGVLKDGVQSLLVPKDPDHEAMEHKRKEAVKRKAVDLGGKLVGDLNGDHRTGIVADALLLLDNRFVRKGCASEDWEDGVLEYSRDALGLPEEDPLPF